MAGRHDPHSYHRATMAPDNHHEPDAGPENTAPDEPPFVAGLPDGPLERPSDWPDYDGPLVCPFYGPDHPARRDEESKEAFNEGVARLAFGDLEFQTFGSRISGESLQLRDAPFSGDWWMLLWVMRQIRAAEARDPDRKDEFRFNDLSAALIELALAGIVVHCERAKFDGLHVEHINLRRMRLDKASFRRTHLNHADLNSAQLSGATFRGACLADADLYECNLYAADLRSASLSRANLRRVNAEQADFKQADLYRADAANAQLRRAQFDNANFAGASLFGAQFDHARVRDATGLLFDTNPAHGIDGKAQDAWSLLRREYTGPRYLIHLVLLIAFLLPFIGRIVQLSALAEAHDGIVAIADLESTPAAVEDVASYISTQYTRENAFLVLIGWTRGWEFALLTLVIVTYNCLRALLTTRVASLRDAEERSGVTPSISDYYGTLHPLTPQFQEQPFARQRLPVPATRRYGRLKNAVALVREIVWAVRHGLKSPMRFTGVVGLYRLHLVARVLLHLAAIAFVIQALHWLATTWVPVPK